MVALVHESLQRSEAFPDGHVDGHERILIWPDRCRVPILGLEPPDEPRTGVRQRVDGVELRLEAVHDRIVNRRAETPDVDLREMESRHPLGCAPPRGPARAP